MSRTVAIVASIWVVLAFAVAGVGTVAGAPTAQTQDGGLVLAQEDNSTSTNGTATASNETDDGETDEDESGETDDSNESEEEGAIGPGAQLAGAIGVQQAEIRGEVENRAFGQSIAAARSNGTKARVVAGQSERIRERLQVLENRTTELNASYENGSIPAGFYHAKLAQLNAQIRVLEHQTNETIEQAEQLPEDSLNRHGVNRTGLEQLRNQAKNMSGKDVSAVAKRMGGPEVGTPVGTQRGPPSDVPGQGPSDSTPGQNGQDGATEGPPGQNGQPGHMNNTTRGQGNGGPPGSQSDGGPQHGNGGPPNGTGSPPADAGNMTNMTVDNETVDGS